MDDEGVETEWAVRWDDHSGIVDYGSGGSGHAEAVKVAHIYGYGTPESKVSLVSRTVTYGPWIAEANDG